MINREGFYVTDTERECTSCGTLFPKTSKTVTLCNSCNSERVKSRGLKSKILNRCRTRSVKKGINCDLELDDIVIPGICPVLGIPIKENKGRPGAYKDSISVDRIDNSKGYIKGNIQILSQLANQMKGAASIEELQKFADWINKTYPRGD